MRSENTRLKLPETFSDRLPILYFCFRSTSASRGGAIFRSRRCQAVCECVCVCQWRNTLLLLLLLLPAMLSRKLLRSITVSHLDSICGFPTRLAIYILTSRSVAPRRRTAEAAAGRVMPARQLFNADFTATRRPVSSTHVTCKHRFTPMAP